MITGKCNSKTYLIQNSDIWRNTFSLSQNTYELRERKCQLKTDCIIFKLNWKEALFRILRLNTEHVLVFSFTSTALFFLDSSGQKKHFASSVSTEGGVFPPHQFYRIRRLDRKTRTNGNKCHSELYHRNM